MLAVLAPSLTLGSRLRERAAGKHRSGMTASDRHAVERVFRLRNDAGVNMPREFEATVQSIERPTYGDAEALKRSFLTSAARPRGTSL
jgi:hypothetical protein